MNKELKNVLITILKDDLTQSKQTKLMNEKKFSYRDSLICGLLLNCIFLKDIDDREFLYSQQVNVTPNEMKQIYKIYEDVCKMNLV